MEKQKKGYKAHCLVLSYPSQGHINPMLQFSKRLDNKGVRVTLVTTFSISKTIHKDATSIALETISDGYDDGGIEQAESIQAYLDRFWRVGSQTLTQLLEKLSSSGSPVDCIVYDAFLPWALDVAKKFGLFGAVFFTMSCAVDNILYHVHKGALKPPLSEPEILLPGLPPLEREDMPSFISDFGSYPAFFDMVVEQFSNIDKADWILCNTFYGLEQEVSKQIAACKLLISTFVLLT
jgi:pathogen-inducible salicylic acid glucosyltransferase